MSADSSVRPVVCTVHIFRARRASCPGKFYVLTANVCPGASCLTDGQLCAGDTCAWDVPIDWEDKDWDKAFVVSMNPRGPPVVSGQVMVTDTGTLADSGHTREMVNDLVTVNIYDPDNVETWEQDRLAPWGVCTVFIKAWLAIKAFITGV